MSEVRENVENQSQQPVGSGGGVADAFKNKLSQKAPVQNIDAIKGTISALEQAGHNPQRIQELKSQLAQAEGIQTQAEPVTKENNTPQGGNNTQAPPAPEQRVENNPNAPQEAQRNVSEAESLQESQNPTKTNPFTIESEFFGGKKEIGGKTEEVHTPSFELPDEGKNYIKENYGFESFSDFESKHKELNTRVEELSVFKDNYDRISNTLTSLPPDLQEALISYEKGEDYSRVFSKEKINYKVDFKEQDKKKVIDFYFPGEFKSEDWEAADPNHENYDESGRAERMIDRALRDAQDRFEQDKINKTRQIDEYYKRSQELANKKVQSLENTIMEFRKEFPDATAASVDRLYRDIQKGEIENLIYNPDGTYKPEAAKLLFNMKHGPDIIDQLVRQAEERAKSQVYEDMLSTQSSSRPEFSGKGSVDAKDVKLEERRKEIKKLNNGNFY